ncbi:dipicolinate synthase subunit DpsA [Anaeromicropila populeti]|uniref:Dipicolinate synthase subunit A n=1 Tax=Anaeromicropila populeti TaxID=37658 RepID=A0A1I6JWD6_9FIRM|nr:dipicolinate synthase subunit DpsA [Anaeromicropila populeti]SFR83231.1 dipicolinate synthase subunit A [Anaeromicropila populeti]
MPNNQKISIIGGDLRQFYMAKILLEQGYDVSVYSLEMPEELPGIKKSPSLKAAMNFGNIIVGPVPFSRGSINITSNISNDDMSLKHFISCIRKDHVIVGGVISPIVSKHCKANQIQCIDLLEVNEVSVKNAIATAEGAIVEAITKSAVNLHKSSVLVLGYGKCGSVLAEKLRGLNADVTVCARRQESLVLADAVGYHTLWLPDLEENISSFSFIFNTIPAKIIDNNMLNSIAKDAIIIDISSKPGCMDFVEASQLGINASLCLGLPGKYSPKTSAEILLDTLLAYLKSA